MLAKLRTFSWLGIDALAVEVDARPAAGDVAVGLPAVTPEGSSRST
jgi:hypothetical protein